MASISRNPSVDYFSGNQLRSQQSSASISPSYIWDSTPYYDSAIIGSDSCDSVLTSPTSPESTVFPTNPFQVQKGDPKDQSFNFGTFEDWMRWDDPSDAALSPTSDMFPELKVEPISPNMRSLDIQDGGKGVPMNSLDDSAVFIENPAPEEPLFQTQNSITTPPIVDVPPREGLYSTPLSWSRPAPGSRRTATYNGILSAEEESKLRDIAMPPHIQNQYPRSPSSTSSPEPCTDKRKKRKNSEDEGEEEESPSPTRSGRHPPVKKTAHNMIEKRYRTNLNDKIAALRDSVPSLRAMSKRNSHGEEIEEDLQGLTPAHKLNKATVLSKATEYIAHLEKRNKYLAKDNAALKARVDAFEILVMSRQPPNPRMPPNRQGSVGRFSMDGMM